MKIKTLAAAILRPFAVWGNLLLVAGACYGDVRNEGMLLEEARRAFARGNFGFAAENLQEALDSYRKQDNPEAEIRTSISLAEAFQGIGQHQRSLQVLEAALTRAESAGIQDHLALVKNRLGAALTMTREWERAAIVLNEALRAAQSGGHTNLEAEVFNDLGNLSFARQEFPDALRNYEKSVALAKKTSNLPLSAKALCNASSAAAHADDHSRADELNTMALKAIEELPSSRTKALLLLTSGQTDKRTSLTGRGAERLILRAYSSLQRSWELAAQLGDCSLETYAVGYLAQLYESDGQLDTALSLTRRAAFAAQQAPLPEALYRWEWQEGRLLKKQGAHKPAIEAYRRAVRTLDPVRTDVSLGYGNTLPKPFREAQGPLFLELADLLLQEAGAANNPRTEQALLREARDTVEHLKAVELNDYFCDDCVNLQQSTRRDLEAVDAHTAVVYIVPLQSRTELLIGTTSGLKRTTVDVGSEDLTETVRQFRRNLETRTTYSYLTQAQQLYDWLIRPVRPWLLERSIDTLVFVPDGALRTIPFAALHDGERFLIQDLAVAVAPGLSLIAPQPIGQGKKRLLLSGLSEPVQGFPPLDFVPAEIRNLETIYPSETLFNEGFTLEELSRKLEEEQFSMVHIASHGQFNRDVRNTFILTHDTKLTLNTLETLIRPSQYRGRPVEFLVLSACQTAAGDDRAALGLAGVAVKAGARSALATLWFVNDQSTSALISGVYNELQSSPSITKARALQAAQIKMLNDRRYRHPCYWSPFLIIGNWL